MRIISQALQKQKTAKRLLASSFDGLCFYKANAVSEEKRSFSERAQCELFRRHCKNRRRQNDCLQAVLTDCVFIRRMPSTKKAKLFERAQCECSNKDYKMKTKELRYTPSHLSSFLFKSIKQAGIGIYSHSGLLFITGIDNSKQIIVLPLSRSNSPGLSVWTLNAPPISSANDFATVRPKPVPP